MNVKANGSTIIWSNTITYPSGNNTFFAVAQSNNNGIPNSQALSFEIVSAGLAPAAALNAFISLICAI
ncbi:hypothetical protein [Paenibacillus sp. Soil750]|uniref:hypothetical protein n=1 Tax=Paenibacillus sp. Soil750 TaxID=1736398 RepID=UPI0006FECA2C|nr:hypothetical protein [Paenibacillus sp. Soil750]KRE75400.1 hypothetical protein ASL11_00745 [Paenibacillus sp. Soil750]